MSKTERRSARRFQMKLPLTVRWVSGKVPGEALTETNDVSSRGVSFVLPKDVKQGAAVELVMTLPHEVTLAGPVRVRCLGRIQRTLVEDDHKIGVVAEIERYEFLRSEHAA